MFTKKRHLMRLLFSLFLVVGSSGGITLPVEMRTVDSDASALIEFRDGETVSYVRYDRNRGATFSEQVLPFVTVPFGRMNMSMPLGTFLEILSMGSEFFFRQENQQSHQSMVRKGSIVTSKSNGSSMF